MLKKFLILNLIILITGNFVLSASINYNNSSIQPYYNISLYSNDLTQIENVLFGKSYKKDGIDSRLNRIENKLYSRNYSGIDISTRMNNIISDYRNDTKNNLYCSPNKSFGQKLKEAFIGVPMGYTPQIEPSPYLNSYGPSYMQGYYGTNGWRDHNIYNPSYAAAKVHILD